MNLQNLTQGQRNIMALFTKNPDAVFRYRMHEGETANAVRALKIRGLLEDTDSGTLMELFRGFRFARLTEAALEGFHCFQEASTAAETYLGDHILDAKPFGPGPFITDAFGRMASDMARVVDIDPAKTYRLKLSIEELRHENE